jgi:hypothetical protein
VAVCTDLGPIGYYVASIAWLVSVLVTAHWILTGEEAEDGD